MSIANWLTLTRLFIGPLFFLAYSEYAKFGIAPTTAPFILLFLWCIAELTDSLDGFIARRYNQVTNLGKILDPMADSIYRTSALLTFTQGPVSINLLLIFVFLYRDSMIGTLRTICALKGFALAARQSGKYKAVIQAVVILLVILLLIPYTHGLLSAETLYLASTVLVAIAAAYSIFSGYDYFQANKQYIQKMMV